MTKYLEDKMSLLISSRAYIRV